jgi:hypothetical protein
MTRIEERLRDALQASAAKVRDDRLRPLPVPDSRTERRARRRRVHRAWLVPAAAAASVVLLVAAAVAVTGGLRPAASPGRAAASPGPAGPPRYIVSFSDVTMARYVLVQSTLTGAVTARVATPEAPRHERLYDGSLAAAPDGRTFYVEYNTLPVTLSSQIRIYTFRITSSGSATPMTPVKGGTFVGQSWTDDVDSLAVSPDGSELALTADRSMRTSLGDFADQIVVINLRTGARNTWQSGLDRPGRSLSIGDLSWAPGGRSLVFLAQWCTSAVDECTGGPAPDNYRDAQARSLSVASGGGALDQGRVLLRTSARFPVIVQAFASPEGGDVTALVLSGPVSTATAQTRHLVVERISASGAVLGTEYREDYQSPVNEGFTGGRAALVSISPDPTGRYLLLSDLNGHGFYTGWLGQGKLHLLPVKVPYYLVPAW